jgi:hypothetical protein
MRMDTEAIFALSAMVEPILRLDKCRMERGESFLSDVMARFKLQHPLAAPVV